MSDLPPVSPSDEILSDPLVLPALFTTRILLADLARHDSFSTAIAIAFGDDVSSGALADLQQQWIQQQWMSDSWQAPAIALLSSQALNGARGAYSSETDTIYLSRDFVLDSISQPDLLVDVLLEEIGHYLDDQINTMDAIGDEGAIFAHLVRHQTITPDRLQQLQQRNDHSTIQLSGDVLAVENADFTGTNLKSALISSLGTLIDNIKSLINNDVLQGLPLLGNALGIANPFDTVLNNFRDQIIARLNTIPGDGSVTEVRDALFQVLGSGGLGVLRDRPEDADTTADADDIIIDVAPDGSTVEFKLAIGKQLTSTLPLTSDLGLPFFGLRLSGDVTSQLDVGVNLDFGVDATTGFFLNTTASDREVEIDLSTQLRDAAGNPSTLTGSLGFLTLTATDNNSSFNGSFTGDLSGALSTLTVDPALTGNLQLDLALNTSLGDSARLPSIGADFELNWAFAAGDGRADGRYQGQAPTVGFNNVRLNVGSFFRNFAEPVFGTLNDILEPIAPIVDVLQTRVPVLDTFGRGFLDVSGSVTGGPDGQVTLLDLVALRQPDAPLGFIGAIAQIIDLTETIDALSESGSLPLNVGGFQLGAANDIRNSTFNLSTVDLGSLSPIARTAEEILAEVSDLLGDSEEIQDFVGSLGGVDAPQGPQFPILTDPNQVFRLLLGQNADFFQYTLPELEFKFDFEVFFPILGPLGALIEGELNAALQLSVGYDSRGLQQFLVGDPGTVGDELTNPELIFNGFYINNGFSAGGPGGRLSGAQLGASLEAFAAVNVGIASAGIGGGIKSTISVLLNDPTPADNRVYFDEFDPSCIFDPITGRLTAGLNAFIRFGIGPFSYTKRFNIASATLLSFEAGCSAEAQSDPTRHRLALTSGSTLQLAMGSLAGDRRINSVPGTDVAENFKVDLKSGSPGNATLTVLAFGARLDYSGINRITANGGNENDSILITAAVLTPAELSGNGGDDQVYGGGGSDRLEGNEGDDALYGGAGNDSIFGGAGVDLLDGGAGADLLDGGTGPDEANDIDTVSYRESAVGIQILSTLAGLVGVGGDAQGDRLVEIEHIEGSRFADTINGDGNHNTLEGLDGNDLLRGGNGDDVLLGGPGRDRLEGGNGQDWTSYLTSFGAVTVDLATGNGFGGDADGETLNSIESLQGSVYGDRLNGNASNNELDGFIGNDILTGRGGADTLDGGEDEDWASYAFSPSAVNVSLREGRGKGFGFFGTGGGDGRDDILRNIENLEGSRFDDILEGDNRANILKGLAGDDTLQGNEGDDTLLGGAGGDTFDGGDGIDLVDYDTSPLGVTVNLKTGTGSGSDAQGDRFIQSIPNSVATVEHVRGSRRADVLTGDDGNNILDPNLSGGGIDTVSGGAGDDQLRVDYSFQDTGGMFGGFGFGYIIRDNARGETRSLDQYAPGYVFQDRVNFGSDIERFYLRGSIYTDQMFGGAGADVFLPGGGNDFVSAGLGDDQILGDSGIDTLSADFSNRSDAIVLESFSITQESQSSFSVGGKTISGIEIYRDISTGSGNDRLTQLDRVNNIFNTDGGNDVVNPGLGVDIVNGGTTNIIPIIRSASELDILVLDYSVGDTGSGMIMGGDPRSQTGFAFRTVAPGSETTLDSISFSQFERLDVTGTSQADELFGSDGADTLRGQAGGDRIIGNRGNDELVGGEGDDTLIGTNNTIYGSGEFSSLPRDIDTLTGGTGADTFVLGEANVRFYSNAQTGDYGFITDFNLGEGDRIQLQGSSARYVLVTGSDSSGNFTSIYWTPPPVVVRSVGSQISNGSVLVPAASTNIPSDGELVGIVRGTTGLTLGSPAFQFV